MNTLSAIDIGSNTVRLLIGRVSGGIIEPILYDQRISRLAAGLHETGNLGELAMNDTITALSDFISEILRHGGKKIKAVGTSALRESRNSMEFLAEVKRRLGLEIEVIDGKTEARLTSLGVLSSTNVAFDTALIIDIGGGSTECIIAGMDETIHSNSIPIGVVKLHDLFIKSDPPTENEMKSLKERLSIETSRLLPLSLKEYLKGDTILIGTAGTATTIASIDIGQESYDREKVHMRRIELSAIEGMAKRLSSMTIGERRAVRGLDPGRVDLIIPGIYYIIGIMKHMGFNAMTVSDAGLLEGILRLLGMEVRDQSS